jgi:hypothetical protein
MLLKSEETENSIKSCEYVRNSDIETLLCYKHTQNYKEKSNILWWWCGILRRSS